jgi:hypothetical protein
MPVQTTEPGTLISRPSTPYRTRLRALRLLTAVGVAFALCAVPHHDVAAAPVAHAQHRIARPIHHNPHLRMPSHAPRALHRHRPDLLRGHWCYCWTVIHHSWGSIRGTITASGSRVEGASVRLAGYHGHHLRSRGARHATVSSEDGSFEMHHVRSARYRVMASRSDIGSGYATTRTHIGGIHLVNINLH